MTQAEKEWETATANLAIALGLTVRRFREQCGMTQEALAKAAGVSQSWVSITENTHKYKRNRNPPIGVLRRIALAFRLRGLSVLIEYAEEVMNTSKTMDVV